MADPLAQFRRTPATPSAATPSPPKGADGYVAFATKDKLSRLRIRRAMAPTRSPGYPYLLDVIYDGTYGTNFVLVFTFLMVLVRGKNLQTLVFAIESGMAEYIQEFDPDKWAKPADDSAAFIESIEVVAQDNGSSASGTGKTPETVH